MGMRDWYRNCAVCPRFCGVDRTAGEVGECGLGTDLRVASAQLHFGEEEVLVGQGGSGTLFLSSCNLNCLFCQNYEISQFRVGKDISVRRGVQILLSLEARGAQNINFVSPTHLAPTIAEVIRLARKEGLTLPVVYNSGGYDNPGLLRELEGLVDIYMPDMKFSDPEIAEELAGVREYPKWNRAAVLEMHRQVGDLITDSRGAARAGLMVRHLVLPDGLAGSREIFRFIARKISPKTYVNVMGQYHPAYRAETHPTLRRGLRRLEHEEALAIAREEGLTRIVC